MGVTIDVPPGVLERAGREWTDADDRLTGAWTRLRDLEAPALAPDVVTALSGFLTTWTAEVEVLAGQAVAAARAFADLSADLEATDAAEAERLRSLLAWSYRAAPIEEGR